MLVCFKHHTNRRMGVEMEGKGNENNPYGIPPDEWVGFEFLLDQTEKKGGEGLFS